MRISFERTGGVAGMVMAVELDTRRFPQEESQTWEDLVEAADFFKLSPTLHSAQPETDRFEYKLTVWKGLRRHTVTVSESAAPAALQPLLERLQSAARNKREG
jgi:hypothetical protein